MFVIVGFVFYYQHLRKTITTVSYNTIKIEDRHFAGTAGFCRSKLDKLVTIVKNRITQLKAVY